MIKAVDSAKAGGISPRSVPGRRPLAQWIAAALAMGAAMQAHAGNPPVLSQAWLAAQRAGQVGAPTGNAPAPVPNNLSVQNAPQLLQQRVVQQSIAHLNQAAQAVAAQLSAQQAAQQAAQQLVSPVPDGIAAGGLQVAADVVRNPALWQNANAPVQTAAAGKTTVEVKQTSSKAILTWDSFNVGRNTTLYFNQSGGNQSNGNNDWIALNRIQDPSGAPSQILGRIKAEGSVYLLNRNGILFGAGSQVNTHSLLASSLSLFSTDVATGNARFLNGGISDLASSTGFLVGGVFTDGRAHDVVIERGANITTGKQGFALVAAPHVSNAGTIVADDGQAILAGGTAFYNPAGADGGSALQVAGLNDGSGAGGPAGSVLNTGLVQARRGSVHMLGHDVTQAGVALASTSVAYPGSIELNARDQANGTGGNPSFTRGGALVLAPGSVTAVLPEKDGATTSSSAAADAAFKGSTLSLDGATVNLQSGSLLEAPGAAVGIAAHAYTGDVSPTAGRVYVDNGAIIDVSGLANVVLPMSALLVNVSRIGQNELANSPLLRNGFLYTQKNVLVDSTQSGTRADGLDWVGSPILNVAGYVDNVPRTVDQLMTKGGNVSLYGSEVILRSGSQLDLNGGFLAYQAGWIETPNLLGANGRVYDIAAADPDMTYVGFAGQYTQDHVRWGISQTYNNGMLAGSRRWDPGFIAGGNAGTLDVQASHALVLDGEVSAQAYAGRNQVEQGRQPTGGSFDFELPAAAATDLRFTYTPGLLLQQSALMLDKLAPAFDADTAWDAALAAQASDVGHDANLQWWLPISTGMLSDGGFATVKLSTGDRSTQILQQAGSTLAVQPGGSVSLSASRVTVLGEISAPAGSIDLVSVGPGVVTPAMQANDGSTLRPDITVGNGAALSTRGLWVNDGGLAADQRTGDRYINGGSISLAASIAHDASNQDLSGSVLLQAGSTLDVSGGGYVQPDRQVLMANGVPAGHGGDISLVTYGNASTQEQQPDRLDGGRLGLDGKLLGYGFSGGGTLSLQANYIQVGGDRAAMPLANGLYLDPGFFAGQGFDRYKLTAITDGIVAPGTQVRVARDNFLPDYQALLLAPTGADLYAADAAHPAGVYATVGALDPYHRYVTRNTGAGPGFSLSAGQYLDWSIDPQNPSKGAPQYAGVSGAVRVGEGAGIAVDAGGSIALAGTQAATVLGALTAHGGSIDVSTNALTRPSGLPPLTARVWLGDAAVLDASGTVLLDPWAAAVAGPDGTPQMPRTGVALDGGSITLKGRGGYVVAAQGSRIDVSGVADRFDLPTRHPAGLGQAIAYLGTPVWSDAGNVTLAAAAGLYFDGHLQADGGATQAEGGTLTLLGLGRLSGQPGAPQASGVLIQQSGLLLPQGALADGAIDSAAPAGVLRFAVDRLAGSGIATLAIGPDPSQNGTSDLPLAVPLGFAGDVNLSLGRAFIANTPAIQALPAGATVLATAANGYAEGNGQVRIEAPYVNLTGGVVPTAAPVALAGDGKLSVQADFIDIGGWLNLQRWAQTDFESSGDVRFQAPALLAYANGKPRPGLLFSTGNLQFKAAQLYPGTDYRFAIVANGAGLTDANGNAIDTTLSILPNGKGNTPLSAGGTLLLSANHIEQQGTLRAPSGSLILGVTDAAAQATALGADPKLFPLVATQSVHLAPGSLTSVSLDGITVPYGSTIDGVQWRYSADLTTDTPDLTAPPAKQIMLNGSDLALDAGAGIDLSGGGHLQASEWVAGTGGTRDVLAQYGTSYQNGTSGTQVPQYTDGRAIYAILPGYSAPVAAYDAAFAKQGGAGPAVGQTVYLSGAPGLPAGYYTLLPARYATLPGAYRVVQDTGARDSVLGANATQADGTLAISGYFADALSGARDARNTTFLVQSDQVWQQYSQYNRSDADSFFANLANKAGKVAPAVAADAGRLTLAATRTLDLGASLTAAPAKGGRGSQVDIAAQAIQVVGADTAARDGYLTLSADGLSTLGAGSLLLGGTRQSGGDGDRVTAVADSVVLSNDAAHPLQGAEILLVANGGARTGAQGVLLDSGSVLRATGSASGAGSLPLVFGAVAGTDANGQPIAAVSGDGALLRVSQNGTANIVRNSVSSHPGGALTIAAGARIDGGAALTLDATGNTSIDASAALSAQAIDANSNLITFLGNGAIAPAGASGFVIGSDTLNLLRGAQSVTLRSRGDMNFLGAVRIDLAHDLNLSAGAFASDGGTVDIEAGRLGFSNDLGAANGAFTAGSGQFVAHANEVDFGAGNTGLRGFGGFSASATQGMHGQGTGRFDFGSLDVNLSTPWLLAGDGADTTLATTGALRVGGTAAAMPAGHMGGALSLSGGSVSIGTTIAAPAGKLDVHATRGDLTIGDGALLTVGGINKTFFDTTTYASGGTLTLLAEHGGISLAQGATLDFSGAAGGGDAGSLDAEAGASLALAGTLRGQAVGGYRGGYLTLGSGTAMDLDAAARMAASAGATGLFQLTTGAGDLHLSSGSTLRAQKVFLTAAAGTVAIDGSVDASAPSGSRIELYGERGVDVTGSLIATSSIAAQRGGDVAIGTGGTSDGTLNGQYGYQNVQYADSGYIHLGPQARIDVSGGSSAAFSGGSVSLRAPLLANGDVRIAVDGGGAGIEGARVVTLEPYARWSTKDAATDPSRHFDGLIDPAGWYATNTGGGTPALVDGTWTDASGKILPPPADAAQLKQYLQNNYFAPKQANADHAGFYGYIGGDASKGAGTLMRYVQQPGYAFGDRYAGIANLQLRPGIELVNPADGTRSGDIAVLTNWNLAAGTTQPDGSIALAYRYQGMAPMLTVRAAGDLDIQASITDGFYQQNNGATLADPPVPPPPVSDNGYADALAAYNVSQQYLDANGLWTGTIKLRDGAAAQGYTPGGGTVSIAGDPYYQALQAPLTGQTANYYTNYEAYVGQVGNGSDTTSWAYAYNRFQGPTAKGFYVYNPTTLVAPDPAAYSAYADYATAYQAWLSANFATNPVAKRLNTPSPLLLPVDSDYSKYTADYAVYINGHDLYFNYVANKVGNYIAGSQLFYAPFAPKSDPADPAYAKALADYQVSQQYLDANGLWNGTVKLRDGAAAQGYTPGGGTVSIASDPYYQALQAPLAGQSSDYYANYESYIGQVGNGSDTTSWAYAYNRFQGPTAKGFYVYNPTTLVAPNPAAYSAYADYATAYQAWLSANFATNPVAKRLNTPSPLLLPVDSDYSKYTADYAVYVNGHDLYFNYVANKVGNYIAGSQLFYAPFAPKSDPKSSGDPTKVPVPASAANNSPSNMPSLGSPASLASATLLGGSSSSYRLVAGAQVDAVDPLTTVAGAGDVNLDNHFAVVDTLTPDTPKGQQSATNGKAVLLPTAVRTGSGSIDIASGGDLNWLDTAAPAVIYTAGAPAQGTGTDTRVSVIRPNWISSLANMPTMLSTGQVNPEHAGDLSLDARGDINAIQQVVDADGSATKAAGTDVSQYWWPWMQTANAADGSASSINFANFGQGVMSAGGNVAVTAGGDIRQLSVSLPTTWKADPDGQGVTTYGGGHLDVRAGGDILSGSYFVAKGQGSIEAGGAIGADFGFTAASSSGPYAGLSTPVSTLFALQDAQLDVRARAGADIGGVYNPSYVLADASSGSDIASVLPAGRTDAQGYSAASSFQAVSVAGNVVFDSLSLPGVLFDYGAADAVRNPGAILPATLGLSALGGNIDVRGAGALFPSAQGNLSLLADQNLSLSQQVYTMQLLTGENSSGFGLIDGPASLLPSPLHPQGDSGSFGALWGMGYIDSLDSPYNVLLHAMVPLHGNDTQPVRLYALHGDIVDGVTAASGFPYRSVQLTPAKPALIRAGRDIVNLALIGQHTHDADVTLVAAGRDIYDMPVSKTFRPRADDPGAYQLAPALLLGGPGSLLVEAGRHVGPLTNQGEVAGNTTIRGNGETGIEAIGNRFNPYLPHAGADVGVLFGIAPGMDTADFMARYVDATADGVDSLMPELVDFMQRRVAGRVVDTGYAQDKLTVELTPQDARRLFAQEPDYVQRQFVSEALFAILAKVGADYNDKSSPYFSQYARGYAAIDTLFPAGLGYTANGSGQGGLNGAQHTVDTGDLDLRSTTIQTQQGGDITVLGPGGQALLGSASAPPVITDSSGKVQAGPNTMGVLTLEQGDIRMFTDRSVLLAQSRVFTEQGGDLVLWSSNGDINAGQGAKTTAEIPPPTYLCTIDAWCRLDARGQVSGAGIATLQTVPGAPEGSVYLVAPRGTVDAGDAGIRVSGNLIVAAARVVNADNIQVQGEKTGVPVAQSVNVGALNAANAAAGAVSKAAEDMAKQQQDDARSKLPSVISVQVLGYGDGSASLGNGGASRSYDPGSPVQVLGGGMLSSRARQQLTPEERRRLAE